jgi:Leucine-rich repeat (LRR) protein/4-hydroxybenzoate polyprenyltransferase
MSLSKSEIRTIKELLKQEVLETVIQGLEILDLLVDSQDLKNVIPYEVRKESHNDAVVSKLAILMYPLPHRGYISLWILGKLAELKVEWALSYTRIDLSEETIEEIPEKICFLQNLTELILSSSNKDTREDNWDWVIGQGFVHNVIRQPILTLPDSITQLSKLQRLDLSYTAIQSLPEEIGKLKDLQFLSLNRTDITTLPRSIRNLDSLIEIDLSSVSNNGNFDPSFKWIGSIKSLEKVWLNANALTTIPHWISELKNLETLNLSNNKLSTLSIETLETLPLKKLFLNTNQLTEISENIHHLNKLEILGVPENQLQDVPVTIHQMPHLRLFVFAQNPLPTSRKKELLSYFPYSFKEQKRWDRFRSKLLFVLKTSRPGLWFPTIWLYLLPFSGQANFNMDIPFFLGLAFVTLPLNLLVYGLNDIVDVKTDRVNPRKDSYLFGARGSFKQHEFIFAAILVLHLLFWPFLIFYGGLKVLLLFVAILYNCHLYNHPRKGWRGKPGLDLLAQVGYLIIPLLSSWLNTIPILDVEVWIYLALFCTQSQMIGEVMDIEPDRLAGRRNTAVVLGRMRSKFLIIGIVFIEVLMLGFVFQDWYFAGGMMLFLVWLFIDALLIFKEQNYVRWQFQLFGIGSNIVALMSLFYILYTGLFSSVL